MSSGSSSAVLSDMGSEVAGSGARLAYWRLRAFSPQSRNRLIRHADKEGARGHKIIGVTLRVENLLVLLAAFCLTKSLLYNVATLSRMPFISESSF